jgi:hypothetical protein
MPKGDKFAVGDLVFAKVCPFRKIIILFVRKYKENLFTFKMRRVPKSPEQCE